MAAKLEIINDNGIVQLSESFFNLEFKEKRTFSVAAGLVYTLAGTKQYVNESIAIGETGDGYAKITRNNNGQITLTTNFLTARNITIYVFGNPVAGSPSVGLQLFTDAGKLTFCASQKYMRVVSSFKSADTLATDAGNGRTLAASTYAAFSSSSRFYVRLYVPKPSSNPVTTPTFFATRTDMLKISGNYIETSLSPLRSIPSTVQASGSSFENAVGGWVTVINVAGL